MKNALSYINHFILLLAVFLFPFFFLPITQEFFVTNKFYFLAVISLILVTISILRLIIIKKIDWQKTPFDTGLFLLLITIALSIIISSPNKIGALFNQNFGFILVLALSIIYFYQIKFPSFNFKKNSRFLNFFIELTPLEVASFSSILLSIATIIFFFNPLKSVSLPQSLQVLKSPGFTSMGSGLDLALFLGFFLIIQIAQTITQKTKDKSITSIIMTIFSVASTFVIMAAFTLTIYSLLKTPQNIALPPFNLSWYSAVEILKNPITALFGIGVDNFTTIFTKVKDTAYNATSFWQISSFSVSRSAFLHIFTETGIFGLVAFSLLLIGLIKEVFGIENKETKNTLLFLTGYLVFAILFFPPSLPVFFLLFLTLAILGKKGAATLPLESISESFHNAKPIKIEGLDTKKINLVLDIYYILPLYIGIIVILFLAIGASFYLLGRTYAAEVYFKKSLDAAVANNVKNLYDNQRQAVILNPYIERFRNSFAQTNFWIANNIASKKKEDITEEDKKTISDAIQSAIAEAKATITLNPQKAINWANLAEIYRNILNVVQGADAWTVSSYQRAIISDPQNPTYRFNLGSVYFSLNSLEDATRLFEQAVAIKPDWANAHYNLAWTSYKKADYQRAVFEMQSAINLIDAKQFKADYEKAKNELEEFKKKLPEADKESTKSEETKAPTQLALPTPQPTFAPRIELPKEAQPEAQITPANQ